MQSPRWLILKDRGDEALTALRRFRHGKYTEEEIQQEYRKIYDAVHQTARQGSFADIFRGTNLKRTYIVAGANFFLQATGQIFTSIYGAVYVKSLGTVNPFNITITIAVVNVCTSLLAMVLTDKLGRRTQVFVGASVQTAALMTMGGIGTATVLTHSLKSGIIAMMVIFTFGYSLGWAPTSHILSPEIPNTKARDMTYRTASVLNIAVQSVLPSPPLPSPLPSFSALTFSMYQVRRLLFPSISTLRAVRRPWIPRRVHLWLHRRNFARLCILLGPRLLRTHVGRD